MLFLLSMLTSLCGETTIYSTAMGDVLIERKFNYLLYDILHMQIG